MQEKDKTQFILRKKHLPPEELAAQTGLSVNEVREILRKSGKEELAPGANLSIAWKPPAWVWPFLLILVVILFYLPVLHNDFVNWDDKDAITDNPAIRHLDWAFVKWMFTTYTTGNWMPLTWFSFVLNYRMGGLDPRIFHATNVLFHCFNTVLVFGVCLRILRAIPDGEASGALARAKDFALPIAFLTALLFGLHPIHVESVAWATERKDVLYSFFYLGSLYLYLDYAFSGWKTKTLKWGSLFLYLLSLLSKPMAVTLPFVFLVLDYWPLRKFFRDFPKALKDKAPFFALALGSTLVTFLSHEKTLSYAQSGVEFYWILNAFRSIVFYLLKMAWPSGLTGYYPFPPQITPVYLLEDFCAVGLVILAFYYSYRLRQKAPYLITAWAYYIVTLAPVLGFIQTGSQAAADRYTYLPSLAFFLLFSAGVARWVSYNRLLFGVISFALAAVIGLLTVIQIGTWKNTQVLWERVTEVYPDENADAYSRLGVAYLKAHRYDEALAAFSRASAIPPPLARTFHGLGTALVYKDKIPEAIQAFEYALTLDPQLIGPRLNLWNVYERLGQHEMAIEQMKEAIRLEPTSALFQNNLGVSDGFLKRYSEAEAAFAKAHQLDPQNTEYLVNLATICEWEGKTQDAMAWYRKGIISNPNEAVYFLKIGDIYLSEGLKLQALRSLQEAWKLHPTTAKITQQIGEDFEKLGKADLAAECFAESQRLSNSGKNQVSEIGESTQLGK